ncbi:MAG: hypothetical protein CL693_13355 [Cellvibrionaceae bacterium]|nr:hypothetical protein [Cellvibrionaceae bacterium]
MRRVLGRRSISSTLRLVLLITSCSALILATIGFALSEWASAQSRLYENLRTEANIVGSNSVAALMFKDVSSAEKTLASLRSESGIVEAVLLAERGKLFARYQRDAEPSELHIPHALQGKNGGLTYVMESIEYDGEQLGKILLWSDRSLWRENLWFRTVTLLALFVVSLMVAVIVSNSLQRVVTDPVLALASTARKVRENSDYGLRATRLSDDEIGSLVDDFNGMLEQIQTRDKDLRKIQETLESKVSERTHELENMARKFEFLAYHDALTGLSNRITFDNRLIDSISHLERHGGYLAVIFLDLDRFKTINDTLGHDVGDKLLIEMAGRLSSCLREDDVLARLGGDEFAVLLTDTPPAGVAEVATKIIRAVSDELMIENNHLHVTTSIGISIYPEDGESGQALIKNADAAMYRSKDKGRNQFTFFTAEMNSEIKRRMELENRLRQALQKQTLSVHYQPKFDRQGLRIEGVEALVRWNDEYLGDVSPVEFIPVAEDCGLIDTIDVWVLRKACADIQQLNNSLGTSLRLSVNVSPVHFIRNRVVAEVQSVLTTVGFPGELLELEITESIIGPGVEDIYQQLADIHTLGVQISIDDFGTGYSSLSRLKELPLDTLKIDRSFIGDVGKDRSDEILVRTIISMAHNLNLKVVAEGVETDNQHDFVQRYNCDQVQGFLFSRPLDIDQLLDRVKRLNAVAT